jgi:hypothetical protein
MPLIPTPQKISACLAPHHLFRNPIIRIKAIGELLAVLIRRMVRQHLLAGRALEGLEAGFALDGLGGGILVAR